MDSGIRLVWSPDFEYFYASHTGLACVKRTILRGTNTEPTVDRTLHSPHLIIAHYQFLPRESVVFWFWYEIILLSLH